MSDLKIFTENIEYDALEQIYTLVRQPAFQDCKVRIMPDVHAGAGCVIGFTADLGDKVIPNIVGVDIGCGMLTVALGKQEMDFPKLDAAIRRRIPSGHSVHGGNGKPFGDMEKLRCYKNLKNLPHLAQSLGTLGGGNHFIEVDRDDAGDHYLVIHSGSRNLGKQVAEIYQRRAVEKLRSDPGSKAWKIPKELCYLTGADREDYLQDMAICQRFAAENRRRMAKVILREMGWKEEYSFETIHNYIEFGSNMVRKGAISAKKGEMLLIPINMRDGCILGVGKGNPDWNCSAPHGAGRIMSRRKAKETVSLAEYEASMAGIFTTCVGRGTLDESPMVYKGMEEIASNIAPSVEILKLLRPVYNFKAGE